MTTVGTSQSTVENGKYFEIIVPDYKTSGGLDSYLRLGVPPTTDTSAYGATLWAHFSKFADQSLSPHTRDRTGRAAGSLLHGTTDDKSTFWDNLGWRDHSDGNRLTTTAGDKVEIIRGNYQLIVLGRRDATEQAAYLDMSGGIFWTNDDAAGVVTKTEYKSSKFGGAWKITEETTKGHVVETFTGEFREEFKGSKRTSIIGNIPSSFDDAGKFLEGTGTDDSANPEVAEGTWASSIYETRGSENNRVSSITSKTYASSMSERRDVSGTYTETLDGGTINTNVYAGTINETYGKIDSHVTQTTNFYGSKLEYVYGGTVEVVLGGRFESFIGGRLELTLARNVAVIVGAHEEFHVGSFREITIGYKWDLVVGWELEVDTYSTTISAVSKKSLAAALFLG